MSYPPSSFQRADGLDGRPGTPTPANARKIQPGQDFLEEDSSSPQVESGEHLTFVHSFETDPVNAQQILAGNTYGTVLQSDDVTFPDSRVLTCQYNYKKGDVVGITITSEAIAIAPPDEFSVETVEFNPSIFLHPRYATVVNYSAQNDADTQTITGPLIIGWITGAVSLASQPSQNQYLFNLNPANITDADVLELALELVTKLRRGEDTFYLSGYRVTWSQYFFVAQPINPGGYIEDPADQGGLPYGFWSSDGLPTDPFGSGNTLVSLASQVNSTIYPPPDKSADPPTNTISWLRQADHVYFQRLWFKIDHSWIGGPLGSWDKDIYPYSVASPSN